MVPGATTTYLASNTMSLLVLFLYMILYPHSRHRIASRGRISFSLQNKYLKEIQTKTNPTDAAPVALAADVDHGRLCRRRILVPVHPGEAETL